MTSSNETKTTDISFKLVDSDICNKVDVLARIFSSAETSNKTDTFINTFKSEVQDTYIAINCDNELTLKNRLKDVFPEKFPWVKGETYLCGGSLNLIADANIDHTMPIYKSSDYDIFVISKIPLTNIETIIKYYVELHGQIDVGYIGSVLSIRLPNSKELQIIVMDNTKYKTFDDILDGFDLDHLKLSYDGSTLYYRKSALDAIRSKSVDISKCIKESRFPNIRIFKTLIRGYSLYTVGDYGIQEQYHADMAKLMSDKMVIDYVNNCDKYINRTVVTSENVDKYIKSLQINFGWKGLSKTAYYNNTKVHDIVKLDCLSVPINKIFSLVDMGQHSYKLNKVFKIHVEKILNTKFLNKDNDLKSNNIIVSISKDTTKQLNKIQYIFNELFTFEKCYISSKLSCENVLNVKVDRPLYTYAKSLTDNVSIIVQPYVMKHKRFSSIYFRLVV